MRREAHGKEPVEVLRHPPTHRRATRHKHHTHVTTTRAALLPAPQQYPHPLRSSPHTRFLLEGDTGKHGQDWPDGGSPTVTTQHARAATASNEEPGAPVYTIKG